MSKKSLRTLADHPVGRDILTTLFEAAKIQSQTGRDSNGRPLTSQDFATLNRVRKRVRQE